MKKQSSKKWKTAASIMLVVELIAIVFAIVLLAILNLLPAGYQVLIGAVLLFLFALSYKLLFAKMKKNRKKGLYFKRGLGCTLFAFLLIICIFISFVAIVGINKMSSLFGKKDSVMVEETTAAYVLDDDPAKTIADAKDYTFGVTASYDWENTKKTMDKINKQLNTDIATKSYDSVDSMVDGLMDGEVGVILLNTAYIDILEEHEGYEEFTEQTRVLFESKIQTVQTVKDNTKDETEDSFIVYVSGSDTRHSTLAKSRSDVNVLAVVNPSTKQILLLNTPRDYYVPISIGNGAYDKLTHCGTYGVECSMDTLGSLYDIEVDHYGQINFNGFVKFINAIGGVTVYSEKTFRTREGRYQIYEGDNQMSGEVALAFVRDRFAFADGDNARGRHQMAVIAAVVKKLSASTIISNYPDIMKSMDGMFATDFTSDEISSLVKMQLSDGASWNIKTFAVSGKGGKSTTYSVPNKKAYVMYIDQNYIDHAKKLIKKVQDGEILTDEDLQMSTQ